MQVYAKGESEVVMGEAIAKGIADGVWAREDLVVSTKIFFGTRDGPNNKGLSRKHIVEGTKASLNRLGLEYVDLLFCHRPDPVTPIEETVRLVLCPMLADGAGASGTGTAATLLLNV